jgi:hypothetical protein
MNEPNPSGLGALQFGTRIYIPVKTVVWVANWRHPIKDLFDVLLVNGSGNLVLLNQNRTVVWSANSTKEARNPIAQLLDLGNLVLRDEEEENP